MSESYEAVHRQISDVELGGEGIPRQRRSITHAKDPRQLQNMERPRSDRENQIQETNLVVVPPSSGGDEHHESFRDVSTSQADHSTRSVRSPSAASRDKYLKTLLVKVMTPDKKDAPFHGE